MLSLLLGGCTDIVDDEVEQVDSAVTGCAWELAPSNFDPCDSKLPAPGAAMVIPDFEWWWFDTTTGELTNNVSETIKPPSALVTQPNGQVIRVVRVSRLTVQSVGTLFVEGRYPLVIAVEGAADIRGAIDGSAGFAAGPGGRASCSGTRGTVAGDPISGSGGGAGGSFGAMSGAGGAGSGTAPGAGGRAGNASGLLGPLRGGCGGSAGAAASEAGGSGGYGGGAIQISARTSLLVTGTVAANGGPGFGGRNLSGGGGGGSGGTIVLESPTVRLTTTAMVCANGGSGGEGGPVGRNGDAGLYGWCSESPPDWSWGQPGAADGGAGGYATSPVGKPGSSETLSGGGGGGGSVGRIKFRATRLIAPVDATVSPVPQ